MGTESGKQVEWPRSAVNYKVHGRCGGECHPGCRVLEALGGALNPGGSMSGENCGGNYLEVLSSLADGSDPGASSSGNQCPVDSSP